MKVIFKVGGAIALLAPGAAAAQVQDLGGGEIIVTAQKRETRLADIPAAINVVTGAQITDNGVSNFEDLTSQVAGMSITSNFGGVASTTISIRGVGGQDDYRPNGSPSVAFHVDNIYQSSNVFLSVPFFDIERVEVLKGPQGTLYGRNSTAGVVNLITRGPDDKFGGYVQADYASYARFRAEGAIGVPLNDRIGLRLAVMTDQGGGFMDGKGAGSAAGTRLRPQLPALPDPGARSDYGDRDLWAARATVRADTGGGDLTLKLWGSRDRSESQPQDSVRGVSNGGWLEPDNDPFTFYSNRYPRRKTDLFGVSGTLTQSLGDTLHLDLVAGHEESDRTLDGAPGAPLRVNQFIFTDQVKQTSFEARLSNARKGSFDWVIGAYYLKDKTDFGTTLFYEDSRFTQIETDYHQRRESFAVFGQIDWRPVDRLTLTGGLRYTTESSNYFGSTIDANPYGITTGIGLPLPVSFDNDFDDDNLSGRVSAKFDLTGSLSIYGAYGRGYKAGGFDGTSIFSAPEAFSFKSETVDSFEGGIKWFPASNRFNLAVDGFHYSFKNLQSSTATPNGNVRTNIAAAKLKGVDVTATLNLVRTEAQQLSIDVGATFLDSEITKFESSNPVLVTLNLGNDLPAAPNASGHARLVHSITLTPEWRLRSSADVTYKGSEYKRLDNSLSSKTESYALLNLRVELQNIASGISVYGYARNVTDERYFVDIAGPSRLVGQPRTFGAGARLAW
ncbi:MULTISPECIES: TonB-dependent receptor [Sphingobium]|jgi:iron complex outermembrane receptor protein|uniref:TonB-denpendent receptor n=1 Tax=Sphingobium lactosutens DS20 TaxID=1331060 RepID=T0IGI0_9SPHN|nr:TonB-dependent receptor [Sphingobium lactosutens]EQB10780.1 hypothetical protein RLDS_25430 [Sphingobium lactosutens DS20]